MTAVAPFASAGAACAAPPTSRRRELPPLRPPTGAPSSPAAADRAAAMARSQDARAVPAPIPKPLQFAFGGASGMAATCVVQPIDLIKT